MRYILSVIMLWFSAFQGYASICSNKQCFVDAYASVDPLVFPKSVRVGNIFDKLRAVVGAKETIGAELLVIESDGQPWALSLPDQTVVLTTGAIEIFYKEGDDELGDARAAFVLGHELAHITTEDSFHAKAFNGDKRYKRNVDSLIQEKRADLNGFTFATIAEFNTQKLLSEKDDFFKYWSEQLPLLDGLKHPDTLERSKNLQLAFTEIVNRMPFYRLGIVLAHTGRYKDAINIFTDYLKNGGAKTKELYINLGYTHLQLARAEMPEKQAYKYWIPTLLEVDSLEVTRSMFDGDIGLEALAHLDKAEDYLKIALDMDENDYITLLNLTAVYMYKPASVHKAYATIKSAISLNIGAGDVNRQLMSIYYLVRLADDYDSGDRWTATKDWYQDQINSYDVGDNLIYNMARLLDDRGRDDTAERYWAMILERRDNLPDIYRNRACIRMSVAKDKCEKGIERSVSPPWPARNIPVAMDIRESKAQTCLKKHWNKNVLERNVGDTSIRIYFDYNDNEAVVIDNHFEVFVKKNLPLASSYGTVDRISKQYGNYLSSLPTGTDGQSLYQFRGASALVQNGYVKELWITELPASAANTDVC